MNNKTELLRLRFEGLSYREIGKIVGISGQRVQQLLSAPTAVKKIVQGRAIDRCEYCKIPLHGRGNIHHRKCIGMMPDTYQDLENLEYLCASCHSHAHTSPALAELAKRFQKHPDECFHLFVAPEPCSDA